MTGIARATMEELLKGPNTEGLKSALPAGTACWISTLRLKAPVLSIPALILRRYPVPGPKALAVFSIVNTLSQFSTVNNVSFLVEGGRRWVRSRGNISTAEPVTADYGFERIGPTRRAWSAPGSVIY